MVARLSEETQVVAVGDIFPGDHFFTLGHGIRARTIAGESARIFDFVKPILRDAPLVIGNLEGPLSLTTTCSSDVQQAAFRGVPGFAQTLKEAGFTHLNLANNHILQHGLEAFHATVDSLNQEGLVAYGLSGSDSGCISQPVVVDAAGTTICLVGYSLVPERHVLCQNRYAHVSDEAGLVSEVAWLSKQFDSVIVSCHAGEEGILVPSPGIVQLFRRLIDAGATCVVGHHPHVLQPVECYKERLIAYSLGNFVFDLFWDRDTLVSAILKVQLGPFGVKAGLDFVRFSQDYQIELCTEQEARQMSARLALTLSSLEHLTEQGHELLVRRYEGANRTRKLGYFIRHITKGETILKVRFVLDKIAALRDRRRSDK